MMKRAYPRVPAFLVGEDAAAAIEYAVMASLVAAACVTAVKLLGGGAAGMFVSFNSTFGGAIGS